MSEQSITQRYQQQGYYFPLTVMPETEALQLGDRIAAIANSDIAIKLGNRGQINQLHVTCPFISDLIRSPIILDAVESIIGPNLLVWGTSVFLKPAQSNNFVSWHQDLTYWGLNNDREVAVWLALGPVNRENGAMRFIPESQRLGQLDHRDQFDQGNILTRGQYADVDIDENKAVDVELQPGQASLHHGHLLHCSGPNQTDQPRLGMVINYVATDVKQSLSEIDFGMLVRGVDEYLNFEPVPSPEAEFDQAGLAFHHRMLSLHNEVIYDGATNTESAITAV
ncbi:MAG: non-heme Fe2+,alpha-ketoglutarate-dependent halogenase [Gammaproteobacteria bacterium]|jgi:non-heme Fe2+,alpha-ketoglutarate-dependent halogenase